MINIDPRWAAGGAVAAAAATAAVVAILMHTAPAPPAPPGNALNDAKASSAKPACTDRTPAPLEAADIAGVWSDKEGKELLRIAQKDPKDATHFSLKGHHDWDGTLADGKLVFTRKAVAGEMEHAAPDWARTKVEGQIEWSLELEAKSVCEASTLHGKWYPGRIKVEESSNSGGGDTVSRGGEASADGKGDPREVDYIKAPKILVFAEGKLDSFLVDKLYVGIPMSVGVVFEAPFDKESYPVRVVIDSRQLELTATPANDDRTLFKTAVFKVEQ